MARTADFKWHKVVYVETRTFEEFIMAEDERDTSEQFIEALHGGEFTPKTAEIESYCIERKNKVTSEHEKVEGED